ncbi:GxxExxY protein [Parasediminibacterium paludis]|uniref:GxxExxY protein n=1 Tax=Parasediminibacterium paludis TaxID=908966 RepID=A0ABV8Q1F4_9BACT
MVTKKDIDDLTYLIMGCAIEVHKELGPGLLESVYHTCFVEELASKQLRYQSELEVPIVYKGKQLSANLRLDVLVEDLMVVELKAVEKIMPVHQAQLLTYLKLLEKPKGILINFNCTNIFKEGQKTMVNDLYTLLP